jgi:hypothetical protein
MTARAVPPLLRVKAEACTRSWSALYQQWPVPGLGRVMHHEPPLPQLTPPVPQQAAADVVPSGPPPTSAPQAVPPPPAPAACPRRALRASLRSANITPQKRRPSADGYASSPLMTGSTTSFIVAASTSVPASTAPQERVRLRCGPTAAGSPRGLDHLWSRCRSVSFVAPRATS